MGYFLFAEKLKSPIFEVPLAKENSDDEEVECSKIPRIPRTKDFSFSDKSDKRLSDMQSNILNKIWGIKKKKKTNFSGAYVVFTVNRKIYMHSSNNI